MMTRMETGKEIAVVALVMAAGTLMAQQSLVTLDSAALEAKFDTAASRFTLTAKPSRRVFVNSAPMAPQPR
jgi:hypothetical protein